MPVYTNQTHLPGITVTTTYHDSPFGPGGTHSIRYLGQGAAAATYKGYLNYSIGNDTLSIHLMSADPKGSGLGSLLLFEAANRAAFHGVNRIVALMVAMDAQGFYLKAGFHPNRAGRELAENVIATPVFGPAFGDRLRLARGIGNWDGMRQMIQIAAHQAINGVWI